MLETNLLFLHDAYLFSHNATITSVNSKDEKTDIQLNETIFYPQGGGQPSDKGIIKSDDAEFAVEEVRFEAGIVHHYGHILHGNLKLGDNVNLLVDKDRRFLNMRNHTAGHVVGSAVAEIKPELKPIKGFHFPEGPYVEFEGVVAPEERQDFLSKVQEKTNQILSEHRNIIVKFVSRDEIIKICKYVPDNIPTEKPSRVVTIEGYISIPDGGTQVNNTDEIGPISVTKIKVRGNNTMVSYKI